MEDTAALTQAKATAAQPTATASSNTTTDSNDNTTTATKAAPPPLTFIEIDPNQRLPLPTPPSDKALLKQAEELVYWAISSKHENSPANQLASSSATNNNNNTTNANNNGRNKAIEAARRHTLLTDLLSRKPNPHQLLYTLHALSTSNSGRDLDKLVTHPKLHAQLIHLLFRMDPFSPGVEGANGIRELMMIRRVEKKQEKDRLLLLVKKNENEQQQQSQQPPQQKAVKIDPSAINHKHQIKYISPTQPFFQYQIADAYLHLIITLISTNSILSVSAVRAIWGLLTDFGMRWMEGEYKRMEERRKWRRRRRVLLEKRKRELEKQQQMQQLLKMNTSEKDGECGDSSPTMGKKQKLNDDVVKGEAMLVSSTSPIPPAAAVSVEKLSELNNHEKEMNNDVLIEEPEGERIVPGMSGLTVDFVKDVFFSKSKNNDPNTLPPPQQQQQEEEEIICSDRLPSGRVHRLLLTLLNIFRLCPRSKSDLLREISNNFPHYKTCPPALYQWYSHVCLQLLHLVPTMEGPIMSMFVDKALDMDVEIKIDDKGGVFLDNGGNNNGEGGCVDFLNGMLEEEVVATNSPMPSKKRSFQQLSQDLHGITTPNGASNSALDTTAEDESDHINEIAERLDTLMTVLYEHIIQATSFSPDSLSEAMMAAVNARRMYRHLDEVFDKKVRTTDRSKFVQFVFFVLFGRENDALEAVGRLMAKREQMKEIKNEALDVDLLNQMDPLYRGFSAKLIDVFFNPSYSGDVPRQTVVCYLASFVSRATYVCPETVCECIAALLRWAEVYVTAQESQKQKGRVPLRRSASSTLSLSAQQQPCEVHALFYTSCQAAFYLMCFRGVEAIQYYRNAYEHRDDPDSPYADPESVDIGPQRWRFLCGHEMQPLKYCLESVRLEFLHLAEDLDLFLDQGLDDELPNIEETKAFLDGLWNSFSKEGKQTPKTKGKTPARRRSTIISTAAIQEKKRLDGGVGGLGKGSNPLGSFFPFDPYLLQKSYQHVHPYYRNWEDCIPSSSLDARSDIAEDEVDVSADMSDIEDDIDHDQVEDEEDDSEEEEDDDDDDDQSKDSNRHANTKPAATNDESFEMEFRRSRAMSTGSQMSW
ncbi:hypothetical protein ACHAWT_001964 [Skeletonema menzelii]